MELDAFFKACYDGDVAIVEREHHHINLRATDRMGMTPLMIAASCGHTDVVKRLLPHSQANQSNKKMHGRTALFFAIDQEHLEVIDLLLPRSSMNHADVDGVTPLMHAVGRQHDSDFLKLIGQRLVPGSDLHHQNKGGYTALNLAANLGHVCTLPWLLSGSPLDTPNREGHTAFYNACSGGHLKAVQALYPHVNRTLRCQGRNGLEAAVYARHPEVVAWLVEQKMMLDLPESERSRPLMILVTGDPYGRNAQFQEIWDILRPWTNPLYVTPENGRTLLHQAVISRRFVELNQMLMLPHIEMHAPDLEGKTPMDWASEFWPEALPLLREHEQRALLGIAREPLSLSLRPSIRPRL